MGARPKTLPLNVKKNAFVRARQNSPKADLKEAAERPINVAGVYQVLTPNQLQGKNIIVLDDVFTTGSTLNEILHTIKAAGAKKVVGLVVAKT